MLLLPREGVIITLLCITVVLVTMNTAMFNLALNDLSHYFNLPASIVSLTVTSYSIMFAISSITYSRLSDFVPLNRLFAISLVLTGGASVGAMLSNHFWILLAARVLQAAGAGAALSLSIVFLTRYVPLVRRGKSMTFIMSSVSLGFGLGPVIGGFVVQYLGWKYLFAITSLLMCIAPLLMRYIPKESLSKRSFEFTGGSGTERRYSRSVAIFHQLSSRRLVDRNLGAARLCSAYPPSEAPVCAAVIIS
ncbi:MFS transporter [Paenibacillus sp. TY11]|uniref:MFS transporter n=1 Tax=Paenibacillus sp. TY11 TaxID=3448633 RepID=UPI004039F595